MLSVIGYLTLESKVAVGGINLTRTFKCSNTFKPPQKISMSQSLSINAVTIYLLRINVSWTEVSNALAVNTFPLVYLDSNGHHLVE